MLEQEHVEVSEAGDGDGNHRDGHPGDGSHHVGVQSHLLLVNPNFAAGISPDVGPWLLTGTEINKNISII